MNIHAQGRLLVKYELVTPNSLRDGAILKSISPGCSYGRDFQTSSHEPQILTQILEKLWSKTQVILLQNPIAHEFT